MFEKGLCLGLILLMQFVCCHRKLPFGVVDRRAICHVAVFAVVDVGDGVLAVALRIVTLFGSYVK